MPRRKSAESLKKQCLHSIAFNMDKMLSSDFYSSFPVGPRLYYVIGPFSCLTTEMTQDLINILSEQRLLKRHHLQVLICTHLKQLQLDVCGSIANHDSVARMVGVRCQTLTKLNLSSLNNISTKILVDLIYNVPQIQSLVLQNTKCNDQVMSVIGRTCCHLRELNVFNCPVTDSGAFGLCVKNSAAGGVPNCSQLVSLDINATAVSLNGASTILQNLHHLKYFQYCDVCAVFEKLYLDSLRFGSSFVASQNRAYRTQQLANSDSSSVGPLEGNKDTNASFISLLSTVEDGNGNKDAHEDKSENVNDAVRSKIAMTAHTKSNSLNIVESKRKYCINSLTATGLKCSLVTAQSIKIACEVCPYVTEVYLHQNIGNKGMVHLTQLSQLHVLEVVSCAPDPITFEEGLVPVLRKAGPTLSRLTLYDFSDIDIIRIGQYCPQLHYLNLESSMCDFIDYDMNVLKKFIVKNGSFPPWQAMKCANIHNDNPHTNKLWTRQSVGSKAGSASLGSPYGNQDDRASRCQDENNRVGLFAHIRSLRIILLSETHNFPADVLRLILINAENLIHLHLTNMQFLTHNLLISVLMHNPLCFLQTLLLEMCNGVDRDFVMRLLTDEQNGLRRLDLIECQSITRRDFEHFLDRVRQDNVDVTITWM
ncbi:uncharacterized protein LOC115219491 [Octopus sinensis]|uniref:Uncharacterized protein LOC115219491 n=1 Tax=Octopus sinensis TaxID=2607531 RepID=A0A6P7T540_9MOLL|nr:uncharacterized protein LOC115219491 [Octopus sinensis]